MLRIAVVEDTQEDLDRLRACLDQYSAEQKASFHIDFFRNGFSFIEAFHSDYDIVFMDIGLPMKSGVDTAHQLRKLDQRVLLIFVTNMAQYAISGYEVGAFDYILKPINYPGFVLKLKRIIARAMEQSRADEIMIRSTGAAVRLSLYSVQYIEVEGHYVNWHTQPEVFRSLDSLKALEKDLPDYYCAINRWVIVNMNYVDAVEDDNVRIGNTVLHISRQRKQAFLKAFAAHLVGKVRK